MKCLLIGQKCSLRAPLITGSSFLTHSRLRLNTAPEVYYVLKLAGTEGLLNSHAGHLYSTCQLESHLWLNLKKRVLRLSKIRLRSRMARHCGFTLWLRLMILFNPDWRLCSLIIGCQFRFECTGFSRWSQSGLLQQLASDEWHRWFQRRYQLHGLDTRRW